MATTIGTIGNDDIWGGKGDDTLSGSSGNDYLDGQAGNDVINGDDGEDIIWGDEGDDTLSGGSGFDWLYGEAGDDTYLVTDQWDYIWDELGDNNLIVSTDFFKPPSTVTEISYVEDAKPLPYWIDASTYDSLSTTRYHIETTEKQFFYMYPVSPLDYYESDDLIDWSAANDYMKETFEYVATALEEIIDILFISTDDPLQVNTITLSTNSQLDSAGYTYAPETSPSELSMNYLSSDIFIDADYDQPSITEPNYDLAVIVHELGHALGLKHPFEPTAFGITGEAPYLENESEDNTDWVIMSYTAGSRSYSANFSPFDIAALQYIYGVAAEANADDSTYLFNDSQGVFVYDGQGEDVIDASSAQSEATIYLTEGDWSFIGEKSDLITGANQLTINFNTEIEGAIGGDFNDTLTGNLLDNNLQGGGGNDSLKGLGGNDSIVGDLGDDYIDGGEGQDTAIFDGQWQNYSIGLSDTTNTIRVMSSHEGTDNLANVETLSFDDKEQSSVSLQIDSNASYALTKIDDNFLFHNTTLYFEKDGIDLGLTSTIDLGNIATPQSSDESDIWYHQYVAFDAVKINDSVYDQNITISDAIDVLRHIVELESLTSGSSAYHAADINNDGNINISDAIGILRHIVELDTIDTFDLIDNAGARVTQLEAETSGETPIWTLVANGDVDMNGSYDDDYVVQVDIA